MAILTHEDMAARAAELQGDGKTVVFTNGCFDLIHRGHIELLKAAKSAGDVLLVGINSDGSVRKLKGAGRPVIAEEDRAVIIDALAMVDHVTLFDDDTPLLLVTKLKPDVLVKGSDYGEDEIVGGAEVICWGGRVVRVSLLEGRATRSIIEKIVVNAGGEKS